MDVDGWRHYVIKKGILPYGNFMPVITQHPGCSQLSKVQVCVCVYICVLGPSCRLPTTSPGSGWGNEHQM